MTKHPELDAAGVRRWTCDGCGYCGPWTPQHRAYSSLADHDEAEYGRMAVTCSDACREHMGPNPLTRLGKAYRQADTRQRPAGLPRVAPEPVANFALNGPRPGGEAA